MADDPVMDEMIEILPDEASLRHDGMIEDDQVEDNDMTIVPEKEAFSAWDQEDSDMTIVPERVPMGSFSGTESEKRNIKAEEEDGADVSSLPSELNGEDGGITADSENKGDMKVVPDEDDEDADMKVVPDEFDEDADMKIVPEGKSYEEYIINGDDYSREMYEMEHEDDDRDLIEEIGVSLQEQNMNSLVGEVPLTGIVIETEESGMAKFKGFLRKIPVWAYITGGAVLLVAVVAIIFFATDIGRNFLINEGSGYVAGKMQYIPVTYEPVVEIPDDLDYDMEPGIEVVDETQRLEMPEVKKKSDTPEQTPEEEKKVHNILLLGEENLDGGSGRGRSDLIMIATINEEEKSIKLTSIMRDILVAIPGYSDNRLNAAYAMGGVSLVYQTLANNLGIEIDNYARVNFESFESIIDAIGGVDIELTEEEASYLNRTNYISKEEFRNVKAGKNHLNGNQALGYCRIRKVGTANREYSDFGRTSRHRMLLESVVDSLKGMSLKQLKKFCDKCLPFVTTDIDEKALEKYIRAVFDIGLDKKVRDYRIPVDGTYSDANLRGMLVTKVDLRKNALELQEFIFGK
ncbi:MAG: LCP family protein [Lachnospiraceae bacterium]|nr:LCP family protein [Lachnospiraceae bacterium]